MRELIKDFLTAVLVIICTFLAILLIEGCAKQQPGPAGVTGPQGQIGPSGVNPTPTTEVQLCNGFIPTYPNIFPEYALCIGNQLWGIYSANGGFMALLLPGVYNSNGIGASCTFTVEANCIVVP